MKTRLKTFYWHTDKCIKIRGGWFNTVTREIRLYSTY